MGLTFNGTFELDIEFLHVIIDECNFVIAHQAIDDRLEDSCKRQSCEVIRGEGESGGKSREWGMREGVVSSSGEASIEVSIHSDLQLHHVCLDTTFGRTVQTR